MEKKTVDFVSERSAKKITVDFVKSLDKGRVLC